MLTVDFRSASSAEITRRISSGALNRSTPKENHEKPPSYVQHMQQSSQRPQYQSPLSVLQKDRFFNKKTNFQSSIANHSSGRSRSDQVDHSARLSASMNPRMDRLTAHKTPFERDRFAESLAKVSLSHIDWYFPSVLFQLSASQPKKLFSDPRSTPVR